MHIARHGLWIYGTRMGVFAITASWWVLVHWNLVGCMQIEYECAIIKRQFTLFPLQPYLLLMCIL